MWWVGQVGQSSNLSWYFYAWGGRGKKPHINLVAIFLWRFLAKGSLPKFAQTALKHCQILFGTGLCHLCPVQCPQLLQDGDCWLGVASLRSSLCSPETCPLAVEVAAVGFVFGGTGVTGAKKMETACRNLGGWNCRRIRMYQWELLPVENIKAT